MTVSEPTEAPADPSGDPRHRLHPLTPLYNLLSWLRRFWFVLIPIILGDGDLFTLALAAFSALAGASSVVQWFYSYYSLHTDALEFRTGLISRTQHTMPYERMQQVSIERRLRHRLFGVAALTVKTAGGGGAVSLDTLSIAEAERLRALLDLARARTSDHGDVTHAKSSTGAYPTDESSTDVAGEVVLRLSIPELALAGVTGQTVVFVLAVVSSAFSLLDDLHVSVVDVVGGMAAPAVNVLNAVIASAFIMVVWFGIAALSSVVTLYDFTIRRSDGRLTMTHGLLSTKRVEVPEARVQSLALQQSILRRLLGRTAVSVHSAAGKFQIPLVRWDQALALTGPLVGASTLPALLPAPPAARRRAIARRTVPALIAVIAATIAFQPWGWLSIVFIPAAAVAGDAAWRGLGLGVNDHVVVARRGALYRTTVIVPATKSQSTRVISSPLQRRVGLATLRVDVAGSSSAVAPDVLASVAATAAVDLVRPTAGRTADDQAMRAGVPKRVGPSPSPAR